MGTRPSGASRRYVDKTDTARPYPDFMQEGHASATIYRVYAVTGRGWALELADLEGTIRTGDWLLVGTTPDDHRAVQVMGVEFADYRSAQQAMVAVVIRKLKPAILHNLQGQRVQFLR